jgi:hypothetical protein
VFRENDTGNAQADISLAHSPAAFQEEPASETQPEAPVQESAASPEANPSVLARSTTPKSLTQCSCGQYLPPDAQFCNRCGTQVGQAQQRRLVCKGMSGAAEIVDLSQKELIIGKSSDCTLVISNDDYVSRHHARLIQADGQVVLEDLNSSNGTFLRVRNPVPLSPGDEFLVGTYLIRLE